MVEPGPETAGRRLFSRARDVLLRPERTWAVVAAEPTSPNDLYRSYVIPLAATPSVCGLVGVLAFGGFQIASVGVRPTFATSAIEAVVDYVLTLGLAFVLAVAVEVAAPAFGGVRSRAQAFKLVAYSGTALWAAGVFALYPSLGLPAAILGGLYSLYTLNLGLRTLMKVEEERALSCFAVVLAVVLALVALKVTVTSRAAELGGPLAAYSAAPR